MQKKIDRILLLTILLLVFFGLVMVFSSSYPDALAMMNDPYHFIRKQTIFAVAGIIAMIIVANMPMELFKRLSIPIFIITLLIQLTLLLGLGSEFQGGNRWIKIYGMTFMPAEFLKIGAVMALARFMSVKKNDISKFNSPLWIALIFFVAMPGTLVIATDFSNGMMVFLVLAVMLFVAGLSYIFVPMAVGGIVAIVIYLLNSNSFRTFRLITFTDPFKYRDYSTSYQLIQSIYAFAYGGTLGAGLGKSIQKYYYLPEAYNDFIFAIIGEELGLVGAFFTIVFYLIILWRGVKIIMGCKDRYEAYLATGIVAIIVVQAAVHMCVNVGLLPTTGLPLPFVSAGGTSLFVYLGAAGLLLNISKRSNYK
ncbi:MAG: putative lipid II flippase FtsW [Tissierellales bacterium]|nr:putative lipid II flippase FtsW [Tissierellales bacterium]